MAFVEGLQILLVFAALLSQCAMIRYMSARAGEKIGYSVIFFFNLYRIFEYVECTRRETGRTGRWFWVFGGSLVLLVTSILFDISQI